MMTPVAKPIDLIGERFGRLTVLGLSSHRTKNRSWECRCDCGATQHVRGDHLREGRVVSCGCQMLSGITKHGQYNTVEYKTWVSMRQRCTNPRHASFERYGGRGITVDPRWDTFEQFLADMGPRPSSQHSIDRIDNNGAYSPQNCRWTTRNVQSRNQSRNLMLSHDGKTLCLKDWARELGISKSTLLARIRYGWLVERVLAEPIHRHG